MEPLLSVVWLWPEGWSLALRSRRSGPGPWRGKGPQWPGAHPCPPPPQLALCSSLAYRELPGVLLALGTWWHIDARGGTDGLWGAQGRLDPWPWHVLQQW